MRSVENKDGSDLASVISGNLIKLYPGKFGKNLSASKRSKILNGNVNISKEELIILLDEIDIPISKHLRNVTRAEEVILQQYEDNEIVTNGLTPLDFAITFFKNKDHRVYKELMTEFKLI